MRVWLYTHMHTHVSVLGDLIPAGDHWTLNPVPLLRDKAGGWGPTSMRHTALTPNPHPDSIKRTCFPEVAQSHPELHQVRNSKAVVVSGIWIVNFGMYLVCFWIWQVWALRKWFASFKTQTYCKALQKIRQLIFFSCISNLPTSPMSQKLFNCLYIESNPIYYFLNPLSF